MVIVVGMFVVEEDEKADVCSSRRGPLSCLLFVESRELEEG